MNINSTGDSFELNTDEMTEIADLIVCTEHEESFIKPIDNLKLQDKELIIINSDGCTKCAVIIGSHLQNYQYKLVNGRVRYPLYTNR